LLDFIQQRAVADVKTARCFASILATGQVRFLDHAYFRAVFTSRTIAGSGNIFCITRSAARHWVTVCLSIFCSSWLIWSKEQRPERRYVSVCPENSSLGPESPDPGRLRLEDRSKALPSQGLDSEKFLNMLLNWNNFPIPLFFPLSDMERVAFVRIHPHCISFDF
jgi:hypothetical protein